MAALFSAINYFSEILANDWRHKPSVINVYAMTMFSFVTALAFLSLFPHQVPAKLLLLLFCCFLMLFIFLKHTQRQCIPSFVNSTEMYKDLKTLHPGGIRTRDLLADAMTSMQRCMGRAKFLFLF
jgi:hypothetical protein